MITLKGYIQQLDELKNSTLQSYKEKASASADEMESKGQYGKALDRRTNIMKATGKQIEKTSANIGRALRGEKVKEQVNLSFQDFIAEQHTMISHNSDHKEITHGDAFSLKIHKDHHENISNLQHNERHAFKCMDGNEWTAARNGDKLHFVHHPDDVRIHINYHPTIPHSHFTGETEHTEVEKPSFEGIFANGQKIEMK
jgi:hypothetical protein